MNNDEYMDSVVSAAQNHYFEELIPYLANGGDPNYKSPRYEGGFSLLHWVCIEADSSDYAQDCLRLLKCYEVDVNIKDDLGRTPLHYAASSDNLSVVSLLIESGAELDAQDNDGQTPLYMALTEGYYYETVWTLLDNGASVELENANGETALHLAVRNDYWENLVEVLVEKEVNIDAKNNQGETPLLVAIKWKNLVSILEYLIDNGADVMDRTDQGETALSLAIEGGCKAIIDFIRPLVLTHEQDILTAQCAEVSSKSLIHTARL
jgi:ankyrin repeat protein